MSDLTLVEKQKLEKLLGMETGYVLNFSNPRFADFVLEGTGLARTNSTWNGQLYRERQTTKLTPIKLRLIPYSVWANRGPSEMSVWLVLLAR